LQDIRQQLGYGYGITSYQLTTVNIMNTFAQTSEVNIYLAHLFNKFGNCR